MIHHRRCSWCGRSCTTGDLRLCGGRWECRDAKRCERYRRVTVAIRADQEARRPPVTESESW